MILSNSLFTKTQQRVLGLLYGAPGKSFYTNEIVRIAAVGRGTVTRELVKLAAAGVLTVSAEGNQKHYQANSDCPVYAELVKIARKLFDVEIPKSEFKVKPKAKPKSKQKPKPVKAKPKVAQKPAEDAVEKPKAVVEEKPQEPELVVEKDAPKSVVKRDITITVDDEGQMGFF